MTPAAAGGRAFRAADFSTLSEALDYAATGHAGASFYSARGDLLEVQSYRDLRDRAQSLAAGFSQHLVKPINAMLLADVLRERSTAMAALGEN